jgi:HK97 family phage major capsid protein
MDLARIQSTIQEKMALLDTRKAQCMQENRSLTAEERTEFETIMSDVEKLIEEGETVKKVDAFQKRMNTSTRPPVKPSVDASLSTTRDTGSVGGPAKDRHYRSMFGPNLDKSGFKSFNEFLEIIHSGRVDNRLVRSMSEGSPSAGGFLVPSEFSELILDKSLESEIVRPRATVWPMSTVERKIPAWDNANHTSTLYGGLTGQWLSEGGTADVSQAALRQLVLMAKKLGIYTSASSELAADGLDFENQLSIAMVKATGWFLDYAFLRGSGAGQPLGLLNDPALITVTKEAGQSTGTILYENLVNMFARMHPSCIGNSVWVINNNAIPQLLTLGVTIGTGGAFYPALKEESGQFTILGRPAVFSEKVPALSSKGDVILADFSQYQIGLRKDLTLDRSIHPGWLTDTVNYRTILRADGMGSWDKPVTPFAGDTLSWCVTLEAR